MSVFILGTLVFFVVGAATFGWADFIFLIRFLAPYEKALFFYSVVPWQELCANNRVSELFVSCPGSLYKGVSFT